MIQKQKDLKQKISDANKLIKDLTKQKSASVKEQQRLDNIVTQKQKDLSTTQSKLKEVQANLALAKKDLKSAKRKQAEKQHQANVDARKAKQIQKQTDIEIKQLESKLTTAHKKSDTILSEINHLKQEFDESSANISQWEKQLTEAKARIAEEMESEQTGVWVLTEPVKRRSSFTENDIPDIIITPPSTPKRGRSNSIKSTSSVKCISKPKIITRSASKKAKINAIDVNPSLASPLIR